MNDKGEMTKEGTEQIKKDLAPINTKPETNHAGDGIEANSSNKVSTGKAKNHLANSSKSKASGFRPWDSLLLEVCAVILLAIYFRRLWILHLLSYLFIGRILKLAFAWYSYFFDTGVIHNISHLVRGFSHTAFKEMDKIFQGDALRLWLASSSIQVRPFRADFFLN